MNFEHFAAAVRFYETLRYDSVYFRFVDLVDREWPIPSRQLARHIVRFLNKFGMRLRESDKLLDGIQSAILQALPYLQLLRGWKIEDCDLDATIRVGGDEIPVRKAAQDVFRIFYKVGQGFALVAPAKTMHLLAPNFFVMWDDSTSGKLTRRRWPYWESYANVFLPKVQVDLEGLVKETMGRFALSSRRDAIENLQSLPKRTKTMAKLADEYYYSRFTRDLFRAKA
ncbi:MAG: hypothetical protein HY234_09065 [Acidobacteria bacterium]|nr:hypothetical protein [Acidobacteriota bacterium]MBI3663184.1 hypothetical protein [Acidobacteriota bacterium]